MRSSVLDTISKLLPTFQPVSEILSYPELNNFLSAEDRGNATFIDRVFSRLTNHESVFEIPFLALIIISLVTLLLLINMCRKYPRNTSTPHHSQTQTPSTVLATNPTYESPNPQRRVRKRRRRNSEMPEKYPIDYTTRTVVEFWPIYKNKQLEYLPHEQETGNTEYKYKLNPPTQFRLEQLVSQMQFRLAEGMGEAKYEIGVGDDGTPLGITEDELQQSLQTLYCMAEQLGATNKILRVRNGITKNHYVAEVLVKKFYEGTSFAEIRVAVCGSVDVGKSTLLGVLSHGGLDNGQGKSRQNIFKHKHELESGRTSDITREILGFDQAGEPVNYSRIQARTWSEICELSSKVVVFLDLAGDNKYFNSTVRGLIGSFPDAAMIIIAGDVGVTSVTREYYQLCLALKIACFIVITKTDLCNESTLNTTLEGVNAMLSFNGSTKPSQIVNPLSSPSELEEICQALSETGETVPVLCVSNVTGENLDMLRGFLQRIRSQRDWELQRKKPTLFFVNDTFSLQDVGTVVSGTLSQGEVRLNQALLFGPDAHGEFQEVIVTGIHTNRLAVKIASAGLSISLALDELPHESTRKGQVLVDASLRPRAVWEFDAEMVITSDEDSPKRADQLMGVLSVNHEVVLHSGCSRQTAMVLKARNVLRSSFGGRVRFRYKYHPEFLLEGQRIVFRDGGTKAIGTVACIYYSSHQKESTII